MLKSRPTVVTCSLAAVMLMAIMTQTVRADPIADFYRGKQVSVVIGTSAGNDYDFRARLIARHMGRHIPGEPMMVPPTIDSWTAPAWAKSGLEAQMAF